MNDAAPIVGARGYELLLRHCAALTGDPERPLAYARLEVIVGDDLAKFLVVALAGRRSDRLAA
jgi:hypothetical protein